MLHLSEFSLVKQLVWLRTIADAPKAKDAEATHWPINDWIVQSCLCTEDITQDKQPIPAPKLMGMAQNRGTLTKYDVPILSQFV